MTTLGIIDLGIGNINSVQKALKALNVAHFVSAQTTALAAADKLLLPGVGSFAAASHALHENGLKAELLTLFAQKPVLGICVGMQLLASLGLEHGQHPGLGLIEGRVALMPTALPLPHVGWNSVTGHTHSPLFKGIAPGAHFYFTHSYAFEVAHPQQAIAHSHYGCPFVCAVAQGQCYGVQFHPEKSQAVGLHLLKNFVDYG